MAVDSCGNQSSAGNTVPSSTIFMESSMDPCDGYARLGWNTYSEWPQSQVAEYNLYADITDPQGGTITGVLLKGANLDTTFNHYGIINGYSYCYYVQAVDTTGTRISTSNRDCNSSVTAPVFNIVTHPLSASFPTVPGTAKFTVNHSDTSATYQWQANAGMGWNNLADFGIYSGTKTDSLGLKSISTALNGYGYRCLINTCILDTSDIAILTVIDNIGISESTPNLIISPNPTRGVLKINLNAPTFYELYNLNGQVVLKGITQGQIDISHLPAAKYQLILKVEGFSSAYPVQKL